ncbi:MAG: ion transporter [Deltaproteobacteria bacterium]|nr:MAG: ion transporter [Deltaproteobacteria bacterium]
MPSHNLPRRDKLLSEPEAAAAARDAILSSPPTGWVKLKVRVFKALFPGENERSWIDTGIILLIAANVVAVIAETERAYTSQYADFLFTFEFFSSLIFTVEYVLRIWVADLLLDPRHPWRSRLRYVRSFMAMVDLLALIPFYLPMIIAVDLRILRAIRLFRLVRVLKMGRYSVAIFTLFSVLQRKSEQLAMASFILVLLMLVSATGIYFAEHEVVLLTLEDGRQVLSSNPEDPFRSIPSSMWWAVITLTSVGYGDVVPSTWIGKVIAGMVALLGVGFVAIPTGILAAGFAEQLEDGEGPDEDSSATPPVEPKPFAYCPHCGEHLHSPSSHTNTPRNA